MKKTLVIYLEGLLIDQLLADEGMDNFHRLMEFGFYGKLEVQNPTGFWEPFFQQGAHVVVVGDLPNGLADDGTITIYKFSKDRSSDDFQWLIHSLTAGGWDYFQYHQPGMEYYRQDKPVEKETLDNSVLYNELLGEILEALRDESIVLILCNQGVTSEAVSEGAQVDDANGFFILASSNCPLSGELKGVIRDDLILTLLELGGYEIPVSLPGRSLVLGMVSNTQSDRLSKEEQDILRERLSGLGYIG